MRLVTAFIVFTIVLLTIWGLAVETFEDPESFFRSVDNDSDGDLDADEIRKVIRETGVEQFDEYHEVEHGLQNVLELDKRDEKSLTHKELAAQWMTFASIMSPEHVGEWMTHAVGLREEVSGQFVKANWTGIDLPRLVAADVDSTLHNQKIKLSRAEKLKLLGAVKIRMLNIGKVPFAPQLKADSLKSTRCGVVLLSWSTATRSFPDVHKYRLFRRLARDDDLPEHPWKEIFEGLTTAFTDRVKDTTVQYDYKIEAWNIVGHSEGSELHDVIPSQRGCDSANWFFSFVAFLLEMRMYSVNAIGIGTFVYFYFKNHSGTAGSTTSSLNGKQSLSRSNVGSGSVNGSSNGGLGNGAATFAEARKNAFMQLHSLSNVSNDDSNTSVDSATVRLPELAEDFSTSSQAIQMRSTVNREYSMDKCAECGRPVTRTTRHQCGMCLRVFCTKHTAIHPHLQVTAPGIGKMVVSTCGINSRCRCYTCAGMLNASAELANPVNVSPGKLKSTKKKWSSKMFKRSDPDSSIVKNDESHVPAPEAEDLSD
jgi:hypothetical protein